MTDENSDDCVICMSAGPTHAFLHGDSAHLCVCKDCSGLGLKLCPICNAQIDKICIESELLENIKIFSTRVTRPLGGGAEPVGGGSGPLGGAKPLGICTGPLGICTGPLGSKEPRERILVWLGTDKRIHMTPISDIVSSLEAFIRDEYPPEVLDKFFGIYGILGELPYYIVKMLVQRHYTEIRGLLESQQCNVFVRHPFLQFSQNTVYNSMIKKVMCVYINVSFDEAGSLINFYNNEFARNYDKY
jgi:hypothetical protein